MSRLFVLHRIRLRLCQFVSSEGEVLPLQNLNESDWIILRRIVLGQCRGSRNVRALITLDVTSFRYLCQDNNDTCVQVRTRTRFGDRLRIET